MTLQLDHNLTAQLWDDPLFWECVPWVVDYRDEAEEMLVQTVACQSCLNLAKTPLYNKWHAELLHRQRTDPESLQPLVEFIQNKRRRKEMIWLQDSQGPVILCGDHE